MREWQKFNLQNQHKKIKKFLKLIDFICVFNIMNEKLHLDLGEEKNGLFSCNPLFKLKFSVIKLKLENLGQWLK